LVEDLGQVFILGFWLRFGVWEFELGFRLGFRVQGASGEKVGGEGRRLGLEG
jgi:hypothetical protein